VEPRLASCKNRLELASKKIELMGITISAEEIPQRVELALNVFGHQAGAAPEVRFVKATRLAVINGATVLEGDTVEGLGVRVDKIWGWGIVVSFKGETRDVPLRQN
jgi:hypothetical protein